MCALCAPLQPPPAAAQHQRAAERYIELSPNTEGLIVDGAGEAEMTVEQAPQEDASVDFKLLFLGPFTKVKIITRIAHHALSKYFMLARVHELMCIQQTSTVLTTHACAGQGKSGDKSSSNPGDVQIAIRSP